MTWAIRPAVASDAAPLAELAERTFREAFSTLNTVEDMDLHCRSAFSTEKQAAEIADADTCTVVAESDGRLVAFAQVHLRSKPPGDTSVTPSVELRRLYVERRAHGTGLARDLMADVLEIAERHHAAAVWLGVWEDNPRAIRFYQKFGFTEAGDHVFVLGKDPQRDLIMIRRLDT